MLNLLSSVIRSALDKDNLNLRPTTDGGSPSDSANPVTASGEQLAISSFQLPRFGLSELQEYMQPIPNDLLRCAEEIPIVLEIADETAYFPKGIHTQRLAFFDPADLLGKTFLREYDMDGFIHHGEIMERIDNADAAIDQYLVKFGDGDRTKIMNYNAKVDLMNRQIDKIRKLMI